MYLYLNRFMLKRLPCIVGNPRSIALHSECSAIERGSPMMAALLNTLTETHRVFGQTRPERPL